MLPVQEADRDHQPLLYIQKNTPNFVKNHNSFSREKSIYIRRKDDLIAPSKGQENGWLNGIVNIVNGAAKARFDGSTIDAPHR